MEDKEERAIEHFAEELGEYFDVPKSAVRDEARKWWEGTREALLDKYGKKLEEV